MPDKFHYMPDKFHLMPDPTFPLNNFKLRTLLA